LFVDEEMEIPKIVVDSLEEVGGLRGVGRNIPPRRRVNLVSAVFQSLSDPVRLSILYALSVTALCVCVIKSIVKVADSKLSYHLNNLKSAGLIRARREGNFIIYEITDSGRILLSACERSLIEVKEDRIRILKHAQEI